MAFPLASKNYPNSTFWLGKLGKRAYGDILLRVDEWLEYRTHSAARQSAIEQLINDKLAKQRATRHRKRKSTKADRIIRWCKSCGGLPQLTIHAAAVAWLNDPGKYGGLVSGKPYAAKSHVMETITNYRMRLA
jgi:hypothetical protein